MHGCIINYWLPPMLAATIYKHYIYLNFFDSISALEGPIEGVGC